MSRLITTQLRTATLSVRADQGRQKQTGHRNATVKKQLMYIYPRNVGRTKIKAGISVDMKVQDEVEFPQQLIEIQILYPSIQILAQEIHTSHFCQYQMINQI